jgi:hypothetical protein
VNPWRLQAWMGHKRIDETMRYVHLAEDHMPPLPERVVDAVSGEADPDRKIVKMLSARSTLGAQSAQIAILVEETQVLDMRKPSALH